MGYFNRDNNRGGGRSFGKRNFGGDRPGGNRAFMYKATCAQCGKEAEVPFKPAGDRPVYCSNCFENRGNAKGNKFERPRFEENRKPFQNENNGGYKQFKEQFEILNSKLDSIIRAMNNRELPEAKNESTMEPAAVSRKEKKAKKAIAAKAPVKSKKKKAKA